jgi:hypothetical protein
MTLVCARGFHGQYPSRVSRTPGSRWIGRCTAVNRRPVLWRGIHFAEMPAAVAGSGFFFVHTKNARQLVENRRAVVGPMLRIGSSDRWLVRTRMPPIRGQRTTLWSPSEPHLPEFAASQLPGPKALYAIRYPLSAAFLFFVKLFAPVTKVFSLIPDTIRANIVGTLRRWS